jgi:hypothetical protein
MNTKRALASLAALARLVALLALLALLGAQAAAAENAYRGPVVIRTYDYTGMPTRELARAWNEVQVIFDDAGITVDWRLCPVTPAADDAPAISRPCGEMLQPNELVLRLLASSQASSAPSSASFSAAAGSRRTALGYSLIERSSSSGPLMMTIFPDLVGNLARDAGADHPSMLGRTIAHELGHLLLGTVIHSGGGLMRPFWSRGEIQRNARGDWLIRPGQARQMRQRLASRHGT